MKTQECLPVKTNIWTIDLHNTGNDENWLAYLIAKEYSLFHPLCAVHLLWMHLCSLFDTQTIAICLLLCFNASWRKSCVWKSGDYFSLLKIINWAYLNTSDSWKEQCKPETNCYLHLTCIIVILILPSPQAKRNLRTECLKLWIITYQCFRLQFMVIQWLSHCIVKAIYLSIAIWENIKRSEVL